MEMPLTSSPSVAFSETIKEEFDDYRHRKSSIMHRCKKGSKVSACHVTMGANFVVVERTFHIKWPKCLKCFGASHNRITKLSDLNVALESALKRAKKS